MKRFKKKNLPVENVRRFLEPGPIVLVSSAWNEGRNIMTMGWYMMMEFRPSLVGFFVTPQNHSFEMIRRSKECVINVPTVALVSAVVGIGNCSGATVDKFAKFQLTPLPAKKVKAPLIAECFANFECRVINTALLKKYCFFVLEVVKAHVATAPKYPTTVHYRGDGVFMVSGKQINLRKNFLPQNL